MDCLTDLIPGHLLIVGPTASGKSRLVVEALRGPFRGKFHVVCLICPTYAHNKTYRGFALKDPGFVALAPANSGGEIEKCLRLAVAVFEGRGQVLLILDDCAASEDVKRHRSALIELAFSGRHKNFSVWLLTQQYTSVAKAFRENVAATLTFYSPSELDGKTLWENYGVGHSKEERHQMLSALKEHPYARLCFRLRHPFDIVLEIPAPSKIVSADI